MKGDRIGIEQGFFLVKLLREQYPSATVLEFTSTSDALDALSKGEVDAYVGNRAVATHIINGELISNLKIQGKVKETASINAIGVRKDWPLLHSILDKALAAIPIAETKRINQQWAGGIEQGFDYKILLEILVPIALLLLLLLAWNRNLRWAVKRKTEQLEALSSLQGAILDHAGHAIIATDVEGRVTLCNPAAEKMFGYRGGEVTGRSVVELLHLESDLEAKRRRYSEQLGVALSAGFGLFIARTREGAVLEDEFTMVRKGGELFPALLTVTKIQGKGREAGYLGVAVDISERKATELELQQAKEEAEQASRAKDGFLATMSHELRTPLAIIIGNSQLLASQELSWQQQNLVRAIESSGRNQLDLVNHWCPNVIAKEFI